LRAAREGASYRIFSADLEEWLAEQRPSSVNAQAIQEQYAAAAARIGTAPSFTIQQVARWKGIRPEQLYQAIWEGRLRAAREGAGYRIFSTDLEEWLAEQHPSSVNAQAP
jgi:excisionase family DNA binding protein